MNMLNVQQHKNYSAVTVCFANVQSDNASFCKETGKKQTRLWNSTPWPWMASWSGVKGL